MGRKNKRKAIETINYVLAYKNTGPNRVKPPKKNQVQSKIAPPQPDPVYFVMEHRNMYDINDDTE